MPDIFNRTSDVFGGSFTAEGAAITFPALRNAAGAPAGANIGLLIQRMALNYSQDVARLYEVGTPAVYYVGGRTNGQIGVDRVIGPRILSTAFYRTYGDVCRARRNSMQFSVGANCDNATGATTVTYTCHFCVITTVGVNVQARDMIINESLQIMFSSLLYEGGGQ